MSRSTLPEQAYVRAGKMSERPSPDKAGNSVAVVANGLVVLSHRVDSEIFGFV